MCASSSLHQAVGDLKADYSRAFCMFLILAWEGLPRQINSEFANKTATRVNLARPQELNPKVACCSRPRRFGTSLFPPSVNFDASEKDASSPTRARDLFSKLYVVEVLGLLSRPSCYHARRSGLEPRGRSFATVCRCYWTVMVITGEVDPA